MFGYKNIKRKVKKMTKLVSQVVISGAKEGKDGVFYADFLLLGGAISIKVDKNQADQIKDHIGLEVFASFKAIPRQRVVFGDRSVTVFEPVALIEITATE